jgi:hypothetical protein
VNPASPPQHLWRDIEVPPLGSYEPKARLSVLPDAEGDVVAVLPPGAEPAPDFEAAHARWHEAAADIVSLGPVAPRGSEADAPLGLVRDLTRDFTDFAGGLHLAAADGSFAVRRELYEEAGGLRTPDELGRLDLLYRLHCAGAVFVAEPEALAHGEAGGLAESVAAACARGATLELDRPDAAALIALPPFRAVASPRRHERPAMVVNLRVTGETPADEARATVDAALAGTLGDLELRVEVDGSHPGHPGVREAVAADPRAKLAGSSLEETCDVPFQVTLPPEAALDPRTLADLHELALGEAAGALHVTVPGAAPEDAMIEVVATAAWRRARRVAAATGEEIERVLGTLFGERWVSGVEVSTRKHGVQEPQVTEHGPLAAATDLGHERTAHLRFHERAEALAERAAELERKVLAERLAARAERRAAERAEARLG